MTHRDMLPIEIEEPVEPRDGSIRVSFASVPRLLGAELETTQFHQLDTKAWKDSDPDAIRDVLFQPEGNMSVRGVALPSRYYTPLVRSPSHFAAQVEARIRNSNADKDVQPPRSGEKILSGVCAAYASKLDAYGGIRTTLDRRSRHIEQLVNMQKHPEHALLGEDELKMMAAEVLEQIIPEILQAAQADRKVSDETIAAISEALHYRLLQGGSRERMAAWGSMLRLAKDYTAALRIIFQQSGSDLSQRHAEKEQQLAEFRTTHGLTTLGEAATTRTIR